MNAIPTIRYSIRQKNLYRGTQTWFGTIHETGERPYEFSLRTDSEEEATRWLNKQNRIYELYKMDLADGLEPTREPLRRTTVNRTVKDDYKLDAAIDSYLVHCTNIRNLRGSTIDTYNRLFKSLRAFCVEKGITRITQLTQAHAQQHILGANWSAATTKLATNMYCNWFNYLKELHSLSTSNPWALLSRPKVDPKDKIIWTTEQLDAILENAPNEETRVYWAVLRYCGSRSSETAKLLWTDYNVEDRTLTIRADSAKGRRSRVLYVNDDLYAHLDKWRQNAQNCEGLIFPGLSDDEGHRNRTFKRVLDKLGIGGHLHSFRDTYITHLLEQGVDAYTVAKLVGHTDPSTTLKWYARLSQDHMRNAVSNVSL